jgi:hypothetical protein
MFFVCVQIFSSIFPFCFRVLFSPMLCLPNIVGMAHSWANSWKDKRKGLANSQSAENEFNSHSVMLLTQFCTIGVKYFFTIRYIFSLQFTCEKPCNLTCNQKKNQLQPPSQLIGTHNYFFSRTNVRIVMAIRRFWKWMTSKLSLIDWELTKPKRKHIIFYFSLNRFADVLHNVCHSYDWALLFRWHLYEWMTLIEPFFFATELGRWPKPPYDVVDQALFFASVCVFWGDGEQAKFWSTGWINGLFPFAMRKNLTVNAALNYWRISAPC